MKYYKSYIESHKGDEGEFYCEVDNALITRHISVFRGIIFWATPTDEYDEQYFYTDQPHFELNETETEVSKDEFHYLWKKATEQ